MIQSIIKRDGRVVLYDQNKIAAAILRALEALAIRFPARIWRLRRSRRRPPARTGDLITTILRRSFSTACAAAAWISCL